MIDVKKPHRSGKRPENKNIGGTMGFIMGFFIGVIAGYIISALIMAGKDN